MLSSISIHPFILLLLVSLSFNGLFGYLSYNFYSAKAVAESRLKDCKESNKSLTISAEKTEKACNIGDDLSSEFKREEQALALDKEALLQELDKLPSAPKQVAVKKETNVGNTSVPSEATVNEQSNVAGIDNKLPDSLRVLVESACNRVQGKDCTHPK